MVTTVFSNAASRFVMPSPMMIAYTLGLALKGGGQGLSCSSSKPCISAFGGGCLPSISVSIAIIYSEKMFWQPFFFLCLVKITI